MSVMGFKVFLPWWNTSFCLEAESLPVSFSPFPETILQVKSRLRVGLQDLLPSRSLLETWQSPGGVPHCPRLWSEFLTGFFFRGRERGSLWRGVSKMKINQQTTQLVNEIQWLSPIKFNVKEKRTKSFIETFFPLRSYLRTELFFLI